MTLMDIIALFSLFVGVTSIVLAFYAMRNSSHAEKRSHENYEKTQDMIRKFYDDTKDLLSEIDKKTTVTEQVVYTSQEKLMTTMTSIINETVIPKKQDVGEELGMKFFEQLLSNPKGAGDMMQSLGALSDLVDGKKKD